MDRQRLPALPRLQALAGCPGRVQRQVHDQPDGAQGRRLCDAGGPPARQLPQLLLSPPALAVRRTASDQGRLMQTSEVLSLTLRDYHPPQDQMSTEVLAALSQRQKTLPCKYFYDERGSQLFDAICELPEYYLTRTELGILETHLPEMAAALGERVMLVEPGSGTSLKTRLLLERLADPVAYVPVDIAREHL